MVQEAGKVKIKASADPMSGESFFLVCRWLLLAASSLLLQKAEKDHLLLSGTLKSEVRIFLMESAVNLYP